MSRSRPVSSVWVGQARAQSNWDLTWMHISTAGTTHGHVFDELSGRPRSRTKHAPVWELCGSTGRACFGNPVSMSIT